MRPSSIKTRYEAERSEMKNWSDELTIKRIFKQIKHKEKRNLFMNIKKLFVTALAGLTLAACGGKGQSSDSTTTGGTPYPKTKYASEVTHEGTPIKGGTLKYALVSASPFKGLFMDELASDSTDSSITSQIDTTLFEYDEKMKQIMEDNKINNIEINERLNILESVKRPKVTENMAEIIEIIQKLIDNGFAYEKDGDVYFEVKRIDKQ